MAKILLTIICFVYISGIAHAETTTFKQQILPIDCVYEIIDVGIQKLRYLTPETCPIDIGPPVITNPTEGVSMVEISQQDNNSLESFTPIRINPIAPQQAINNANTPRLQPERKGKIAIVSDVIKSNSDDITIALSVGVMWVAGVVFVKYVRTRRYKNR